MKEPGRHVKAPAEDSRIDTLLRQLDLLVAELETLGIDVAAARHAERLRATPPQEPFDPITAVRLALAQAGNQAKARRRVLMEQGHISDDVEVVTLSVVGNLFMQAASAIAVACQNQELPDPWRPA